MVIVVVMMMVVVIMIMVMMVMVIMVMIMVVAMIAMPGHSFSFVIQSLSGRCFRLGCEGLGIGAPPVSS